MVQLNLKKPNTLAKAKVWKYSLWRHGDEENVKREQAIVQLGWMLKGLIGAAGKKHLKLAPFIGIGCPGVIEEDGSIDRGAQNLPGNWESSKFNLPLALYGNDPDNWGARDIGRAAQRCSGSRAYVHAGRLSTGCFDAASLIGRIEAAGRYNTIAYQ